MQISLLLMQQIAQLFLILLMGYAVVKTGLLKASDNSIRRPQAGKVVPGENPSLANSAAGHAVKS